MKTKWLAFVIMSFLFSASSTLASATEQCPEVFLSDGKQHALYGAPFRDYIDANNLSFESSSTACWRGHVGEWEVQDGILFLVKLHDGCPGFSSTKVFPEEKISKIFSGGTLPIKASWFSGTVQVDYNGKMLEMTFKAGKLLTKEIKDWPSE